MRVFISYAHAESQPARRLADALKRAGIDVFEDDLLPGENWAERLRDELRTRDIIVWLSSAAALISPWSRRELRELDLRGVELVIANLGEVDLPPALRHRTVVDLGGDFDGGVHQLIEHVRTMARLDFSELTSRTFEDLAVDLLHAMDFEVDRTAVASDSGIDAYATYQRADSSGSIENETWLVQAKFYPQERASLEALRKFTEKIITLEGPNRGLLITNGRLTSVTDEFRKDLERRAEVQLRVLDGTELRQLLRQYPAVAARHFGGGTDTGAKS